jgi:hypothetical protein
MSNINRNRRIHVIAIDPRTGSRFYLNATSTTRNARGEIVLAPVWSSEPSNSNPLPYEHAVIFKRRMRDEHRLVVHFAQSAGNTAELLPE